MLEISISQNIKLIEKLKENISKHKDKLSNNEALVRYSLIDPFLRSLGWDTSDPSQVIPEFSTDVGRPDYALFLKDRNSPIAFLGAKKLGKNEDLNQHISYCVSEGVRFFIATDGQKWEIYDAFRETRLPDKKVAEWDLIKDKPEEIAIKSLCISNIGDFGIQYPETLFTSNEHQISAQEVNQGQETEGTPVHSAGVTERKTGKGKQISLKDLIDQGLINPGTRIFHESRDKTYSAEITVDGKIKLEDGSIESSLSTAALKLTNTSINGWIWWYYVDKNGEKKALDHLREKVRV